MERISIRISKEELRGLVKTRKRMPPPSRRHKTKTDYTRHQKHRRDWNE